MSPTDLAAWWGAVVATAVVLWDIYKWRKRGPDVRVSATPGMIFMNVPGVSEEDRYISVTATNHGAQPTTIKTMGGAYYTSALHRLFRRGGRWFVVPLSIASPPLPHVLRPGEQWSGAIEQSDLFAKLSGFKALYCGVTISTSPNPILIRTPIPKPTP